MKNKAYPYYELPLITNLRDMVQQKALKQPDKTAFTFPLEKNQVVSRTYQNVYDEMNALGTWLDTQRICKQHIAIIGENSYEWLLCFLTIVNSGNVAVPIDKELPQNEVKTLLQKADVSVVFCAKSYMDLVEGMDDILVFSMADMSKYVECGKESLQKGNTSFLDFPIASESLCCIFFTSGTSGQSKGVMLSQKNLTEEINNTCKLFVLEGNTIALLPFHHAFGLVVGILMVFNYGYETYINKSLKTIKPALLAANPQTLFLVPLFVETFYKQIWDTAKQEGKGKILRKMIKISNWLLYVGIDIRKKCFYSVRKSFGGNLKYIISGGAGIDSFYIKEFRSLGIEILNGYGTTECAPCAAVNRNFYHKDGTVGIAVPNTQIRIAEDGEVLISGEHVMMGYYKEPQETAKVIHNGWYATGDIGFIDEEGFLTLTGRKKNLIILSNGENISPEELEADFRKYEGVKEVLIYEKNGVIIAEIYPDEEYMENVQYFEEIRKKVNYNRPIYKQVARIILRDNEFTKNTSMKIMRYKHIQ